MRYERMKNIHIRRMVEEGIISHERSNTYDFAVGAGVYLDSKQCTTYFKRIRQDFQKDSLILEHEDVLEEFAVCARDCMHDKEKKLIEGLRNIDPRLDFTSENLSEDTSDSILDGLHVGILMHMSSVDQQRAQFLYRAVMVMYVDLRDVVSESVASEFSAIDELDEDEWRAFEQDLLNRAEDILDGFSSCTKAFMRKLSEASHLYAREFLVEYVQQTLSFLCFQELIKLKYRALEEAIRVRCRDLLQEHTQVLVRKKRKYTTIDDYGIAHVSPKWEEEKLYFFEHVILNDAVLQDEVHQRTVTLVSVPQPEFSMKLADHDSEHLVFIVKEPLEPGSSLYQQIVTDIEKASEQSGDSLPQTVSDKFRADMTGEEYELFCVELLTTAGWNAQTTQTSGDFGIDVLARKESLTVVIQCKRYQNSVGISAVQEIIAGKAHVDADYAAVVTNSQYTSSAITLAQSTNTFLLHHEDLVHLDDIFKQG